MRIACHDGLETIKGAIFFVSSWRLTTDSSCVKSSATLDDPRNRTDADTSAAPKNLFNQRKRGRQGCRI